MMTSALECASNGWPMIVGGLVVLGVLALSGAALVKYLFLSDRPATAA